MGSYTSAAAHSSTWPPPRVADNKVEAAYFRTTLLARRRNMMDRWAKACSGEPMAGNNVAPPYAEAAARWRQTNAVGVEIHQYRARLVAPLREPSTRLATL
jgi:hypothetical protein